MQVIADVRSLELAQKMGALGKRCLGFADEKKKVKVTVDKDGKIKRDKPEPNRAEKGDPQKQKERYDKLTRGTKNSAEVEKTRRKIDTIIKVAKRIKDALEHLGDG